MSRTTTAVPSSVLLISSISALAVCLVGCTEDRTPAAPADPPKELSFESFFQKKVDVFGIPVHATAAAPDDKVRHGAGVLAQYLDNDGDGQPDDPFLVETLLKHDGRLFMAVDRDELDEIFDRIEENHPGTLANTAWWVNPEGITEPDWIWQDLQTEETLPGGGEEGEFDGALEEVLHLVSHVGLANAYPDAFAEAPGSRLAMAMDKMRGGQFLGVPDRYPDVALYTYYDETCVYQCQATEYIYWALTSLLGGQAAPERLEDVGEEWRLNTADKLATGDPDVHALLTDPEYNLPSVLPDGVYTGFPLEIVLTDAAD